MRVDASGSMPLNMSLFSPCLHSRRHHQPRRRPSSPPTMVRMIIVLMHLILLVSLVVMGRLRAIIVLWNNEVLRAKEPDRFPNILDLSLSRIQLQPPCSRGKKALTRRLGSRLTRAHASCSPSTQEFCGSEASPWHAKSFIPNIYRSTLHVMALLAASIC